MSQDTKTPGSIIWPSEKFVHERIAQLMIDIGMPNDTPLWDAFSQFETDLRSRVEVAPASAQPDRGAVVPDGFVWPEPPPSKGQSHVLFEDGFAEGWAKAIDTVRTMLTSELSPASQPVAPEVPDLLDALQKAARLLRAAGFAMTGTATSQIVAAIEAHAQQEAAPADKANNAGFEAWAKSHGGLPLDRADDLQTDDGLALPTYKFGRTEIAWRAWANRPSHSEREAANAGGLPTLAWLIDPGAGSATDKVTRYAPSQGMIDDVRRRGGSITELVARATATIAAGQEAANAKDAARPIPDSECAQGSCARGADGCRGRCCLAGHKLPIVADIDPAAMAATPSSAAGKEGG